MEYETQLSENFFFSKVKPYIYSDLQDHDKLALCFVNKYIESCNVNNHKKVNDDNDSLENIGNVLAWTSLYYRQDKIAHKLFENSQNVSSNINWFRVLCCYLDLQRIKTICFESSLNENTKPDPSIASSCDYVKPQTVKSIVCEPVRTFNSAKSFEFDTYILNPNHTNVIENEDGNSGNCIQGDQEDIPMDKQISYSLLNSINKEHSRLKRQKVCYLHNSDIEKFMSKNRDDISQSDSSVKCLDSYFFIGSYIFLSKMFIHNIASFLHNQMKFIVSSSIQSSDLVGTRLLHPRSIPSDKLIELYIQIIKLISAYSGFSTLVYDDFSNKFETINSLDGIYTHITRHLIRPNQKTIVILNSLSYIERSISMICKMIKEVHGIENGYKVHNETSNGLQTKFNMGQYSYTKCCIDTKDLSVLQKDEVFKMNQSSIEPINLNNENKESFKFSGDWINPKFVECFMSFETNYVPYLFDNFLCQLIMVDVPLESKYTKDWKYHVLNSTEDPSNNLMVYIQGLISVIRDLLQEFWKRLHTISCYLSISKSDDFLFGLKLAVQYMSNQSINSISTEHIQSYIPLLRSILNVECIPDNLILVVDPARIALEQKYLDLLEVQKQNDLKKKETEENEMERCKVANEIRAIKDKKRKEALDYILNVIDNQTKRNKYDPFCIIGVPPNCINDSLLVKVKRKLSLLIHPDKFMEDNIKEQAKKVFNSVNESIDHIKQIMNEKKEFMYIGPLEKSPFSEEIGISFINFEQNKTYKRHIWCGAPAEKDHSNQSKKQQYVDSNGSADTNINSLWHPRDFYDFLKYQSKSFWTNPTDSVPVPKLTTYSNTKSNIWISIPDQPYHSIRLFFSRPCRRPTLDDVSVDYHKAEDDFTILVPNYLCKALKKEMLSINCSNDNFEDQCKLSLSNLESFCLIATIRSHSLNLSEWILTYRESIQPVANKYRQEFLIFIGIQALDTRTQKVSQVKWVSVHPRKFLSPTSKAKVISLINLFYNVPKEYNILSLIKQHPFAADLVEFPSVPVMMGWTNATLVTILDNILNGIACYEINRKFSDT